MLYTLSLDKGAAPRAALAAAGKPDRLGDCHWVSNQRLVCAVYGVVLSGSLLELLPFTRLVAVNADGSDVKLLSTKSNFYSRGLQLGGGYVIDWLPEEDDAVLMTRTYLPDAHLSTRLGSTDEGLGVDWIDTRTLRTKRIEPPHPEITDYITDGYGTVRMIGREDPASGAFRIRGS